MSTPTITEFLEARIAEDEAAARTAELWADDGPEPHLRWFGQGNDMLVNRLGKAGPHVARHDPARVLAECAAKRAIVERHHPDRQLENWYWSQRSCEDCGARWHKWLNNDVPTDIGPEQGCPTLRILASVHKDHPDYNPEWAL
jgi:hypothetical protein